MADLLASSPGLAILATSRAPLHLRAEHLFKVGPLALPEPAQYSDLAAIAGSPAVTLFARRSSAVAPEFVLTEANAAAVAAICARLDGLPLALELAASHSPSLDTQALLAQLEPRLALLTDGPRDLPEHQQTLRTAISWSYNLLSPEQQELSHA